MTQQNPNSELTTSSSGKILIKHFEQLRLVAYDDKQPKKTLKPGDNVLGTLTIGYGATRINGRKVQIGDTITEREANDMFEAALPARERLVRGKVTRPLLPREMDACVSFVYNAGTGYYDKAGNFHFYDLWKHVNSHKGKDYMQRYWQSLAITSGGERMPGLVRRRRAESMLYTTGMLSFS